MSRPPKPAATAKKVAPPAVPHEFRHSGSSFGSAGYASCEDTGGFLPAPEPGVPRGNSIISFFILLSIIFIAYCDNEKIKRFCSYPHVASLRVIYDSRKELKFYICH